MGNPDSFITSYVGKKWVVMDSNHRRHSQQIYSLPHLATLVTTLAFQKRLQRYCFYFVPPNILAFIFIFPFVFLLFGSFFLSIGGFCRLFLSKSVFFLMSNHSGVLLYSFAETILLGFGSYKCRKSSIFVPTFRT